MVGPGSWLANVCDSFSRYVPEREFEHVSERRLYEISQGDFERALELLRERDLPEYEEHVYNAVARAASQTRRVARRSYQSVVHSQTLPIISERP